MGFNAGQPNLYQYVGMIRRMRRIQTEKELRRFRLPLSFIITKKNF